MTGINARLLQTHLGYHHSVITRLIKNLYIYIYIYIYIYSQTNDVNDRARTGRPKTTSVHEDRNLLTIVEHAPFTSAPALRNQRNTKRRIEIISRLRNIMLVDLLNVLGWLTDIFVNVWCGAGFEEAGTWLLGEGSIDLMSVGCYCGLLTVEFVFGDGIRVDLLLNTFNLPVKLVEDH